MNFQLISDAIRNGDKHKPTMEMADFWLLDKSVVHKLFKVLCPRFNETTTSVTRMYKAPREYPCVDHHKRFRTRSIIELKGHPYPPVVPDMTFRNRNLIHNVLLDEAKRDSNREKAKQLAAEVKINAETATKTPIVELTEKQ
jgi:large subunit ribosomal protein L17